MEELIINLHMHTCYSDGTGTHNDLALAALETNVDVLIITDHNVLVKGVESYYENGGRRVLLLIGEEIHDQSMLPQHNHMLVFGTNRELSTMAANSQALINSANLLKGLTFLAHPVEKALPSFGEEEISWVNWNISGFTGIELWNGFSELKSVTSGRLDIIGYAFFPELIPHKPDPEILIKWDELLNHGQHVVAIGGSDAHALRIPIGPFRKEIFPYTYHFSTINTHALSPRQLTGSIDMDREMVYGALSAGHCFVGNDLPAPTKGFRFSAQGRNESAIMGDEIQIDDSIILQCNLPSIADIHLIKNGICIKKSTSESLIYSTSEPGIYRIEAYKNFLGKLRGWIFSNPIYVR